MIDPGVRFGMNAHNSFFLCGYSFQNKLGFQRDSGSFGSGFPIGARAPCWLRIPKGTAVSPAGSVGASKCLRHFEVATGDPHPLAVVPKGGGAALAGGIQRRAAPLSGRKNPKKPAVSWHTTLRTKSGVLWTSSRWHPQRLAPWESSCQKFWRSQPLRGLHCHGAAGRREAWSPDMLSGKSQNG